MLWNKIEDTLSCFFCKIKIEICILLIGIFIDGNFEPLGNHRLETRHFQVQSENGLASNSICLCTQVCVHIACWKTASSRTSTIRMATKPGTIARTIPATGSYK